MAFTKITEEDLVRFPGVRGQETVPRISVDEKQAKFEERAEKVLVPAFNRLVDELEAEKVVVTGEIDAEKERAEAVEKELATAAQNASEEAGEAKNAASAAAEAAAEAKAAAEGAAVTAGNAMPVSGGTFEGLVVGAPIENDTIPAFRNIVVVPANTDLTTLNIPAGTIVMVLKA